MEVRTATEVGWTMRRRARAGGRVLSFRSSVSGL